MRVMNMKKKGISRTFDIPCAHTNDTLVSARTQTKRSETAPLAAQPQSSKKNISLGAGREEASRVNNHETKYVGVHV